jgi:hypothetical protein
MTNKPAFKSAFVNDRQPAQEIVVSNSTNRALIHYAFRKGKLRKIARGLYTTNLTDLLETVVRRNVWHIAAKFFPGALVADRTAIENRPAEDGSVFLVANRTKGLSVPGITFWPRRGALAVPDSDRPFIDGLFLSSQARALLDNLRSSRGRSHIPRTLRRKGVEQYIERTLRNAGEKTVNRLRDEAKKIAAVIHREKEAALLSKMIGAMMGTQSSKLDSPTAIARGKGDGYDPDRLDLFESLRADLASAHFADRPAKEKARYLPFFEAYFSNFIEGTEFVIGEAYKLVYENVIPAGRPDDAHDVLATFKIVADNVERSRTAATASEFVDLLRSRHAILLGARVDKHPGEFKTARNRVGLTEFVAPELVRGTLKRGFEILTTLQSPMARAIFVMFLVSEVHPFDDGNGRIARIAMNAELSVAHQERIIIPTGFRTEYLQALRALSNNGFTKSLMRVLGFAQKYVSEIDFDDYQHARSQLERTNAFNDPADAMGMGPGLLLPSTLSDALPV